MIIPVHMLAFAKDGDRSQVRPVEIPVDGDITKANDQQIHEDILELVFVYGQNEKQPKQIYSVSVGDVAEVNGRYFMCASMGWDELSKDEFNSLVPPTSTYAYQKSIKESLKDTEDSV